MSSEAPASILHIKRATEDGPEYGLARRGHEAHEPDSTSTLQLRSPTSSSQAAALRDGAR